MPDGIADHDVEVPLGWTLSDAARRQLQAKADRLRSDPGSPYRTVLELLRPRQLRGGARPPVASLREPERVRRSSLATVIRAAPEQGRK